MPLTLCTPRLPETEVHESADSEAVSIPKAGAYDVVVVGGGTGGAVAAIVAGQEGLRVAVIEPQSFLGGIGTGGGIHSYYHGLQTGVQLELDRRTALWNERIGGKAKGFHPEAKKLALQEMANEAGVRFFFRCFFAGAVRDGKGLRGIAAEGAAGLFWLEARVVIDATGDADVAAAAGAPFLFGREGDLAPQPFSLAPGLLMKGEAVGFRNFDAGYVDPTNARDLSRAQREGRAHLGRPRYEVSNRMLYVAPILGVRESRFIEAEYVLTLADQRAQRSFPDSIARAKAHYDNHAFDYENESLEARLWVAAGGQWSTLLCHDVPYRCLLPKRVENLLVACRAVGMTHDAHHLFRMQRDIQALGEAAAVAAAQAIRSGVSVREVDVQAVQRRLVERGALPQEVLDGEGLGKVLTPNATLERASVPDLLKSFGSVREAAAIQELLCRGVSAHEELRAALTAGHPDARLMSAVVLALQGLGDGAEVLKETLAARREDPGEGHRDAGRWQGALFLLEKLGLRETGALEMTLDLLEDQALTVRKAVSAIRILARHARAEEALPALRRVLLRQDVETSMALQVSTRDTQDRCAEQERRFELDLAAAQALAKFGAREEAASWAERHLHDDRALVRAYARHVVEGLGFSAEETCEASTLK